MKQNSKISNDAEYQDAATRIKELLSLEPSLSSREKFELNQLQYLIASYNHTSQPTPDSKVDLDHSTVQAIEAFYLYMSQQSWHVATGISSTPDQDKFIVYTKKFIDPFKLALPSYVANMTVEYEESGPIVTTNPESMKEAGVL